MIWKEDYKIGVDLVDRQHQELFKRLNTFIKVVRSDEDQDEKIKKLEETLNFMGEYVVEHFNAEEALQKRYDFPDYEQHHQIHEEFKAEVAEFKKEFTENEYDEDFVMEFTGRLLSWLINHVGETDQKIGDHINQVALKEGEQE